MPSLVSATRADGKCPPAIKALSVSLASCFEDFSVMSGLQGLFVWKQKATTDAPDTQFTLNTKLQAQKSRGAIPAFPTAFTKTL